MISDNSVHRIPLKSCPMQTSFSDLEYSRKKKLTRRDRFLSDLEAITPWASLLAVLAPAYPSGGGPGRPPIGLERMLRMYLAATLFRPVG
jgi:IS5 family transposase